MRWMGSQVVVPRGNQLRVTPKKHHSKPSLTAFEDHGSSPPYPVCSLASFLFLGKMLSNIQS